MKLSDAYNVVQRRYPRSIDRCKYKRATLAELLGDRPWTPEKRLFPPDFPV